MPAYCAIPPLDQDQTRIGRGFGLGYNRAHTSTNQLHGGMDFVAQAGTPILAPIPGDVVLVSTNTGPRITAAQAQGGAVGQVRGMGGYGNAVVLEHRFDIPGLPNPFWTSYNHMQAPPAVHVGQHVGTGTLLGFVGNTTNGQFPGMGAHLHNELRIRPFPGSYNRDTRDPSVLYQALGIDWVGARREVQRNVGGQLLVRSGGPSDCRAGAESTLAALWDGVAHGMRGEHLMGLGTVPDGYVDPAQLTARYSVYGSSREANQNVDPPDYNPDDVAAGSGGVSDSGLALFGSIASIIGLGLALMRRK